MEKYLVSGRKVNVIENVTSGYLVQDIYVDGGEYDGPILDDNIYLVEMVFDQAPTVVYDKGINKLKSQIDELTKRKSKIYTEIRDLESKEKERTERFKRFEQLQGLDDFIEGKITHYVLLEWEPKIIEFNKAICDGGGYDKELKLLSLFGNTKGNLEWRINDYKDGSGSWTVAIPCLSYDDALKELQKYIDSKVADEPRKTIIDVAKKYKLKIPDKYIEDYENSRKKSILGQIEETEKRTKKYRAELEKLKEKK